MHVERLRLGAQRSSFNSSLIFNFICPSPHSFVIYIRVNFRSLFGGRGLPDVEPERPSVYTPSYIQSIYAAKETIMRPLFNYF